MLAPLFSEATGDGAMPAPVLRSYRDSDAPALARYANDVAIAQHMHDAVPHEYSRHDAEEWIRHVRGELPQCHYSIALDDDLVGGVALAPGTDIYAHAAEISYWVADAHWGRGLGTFAVREVTEIAFAHLGFTRVFARVFVGNPASQRVLEKAGYALEGVLRKGALKDGEYFDLLQFARVR